MGEAREIARIPLPVPELRALLQLRVLPGLGDGAVLRVLRRFGSARAAVAAGAGVFREAAGGEATSARGRPALLGRVDAALEAVEARGMAVRAAGWPGYPGCLLHLHDPPPVLFLRGEAELLHRRAVAVVGTRRASGYGRRAAAAVAARLAGSGVVVVSGLAAGVDAAAHAAALDGGGTTVAVLGTGADVVYPRSNLRLYRRILREGLVVSEFLPGERGLPYHFPRRNRIIAALSRAVVVAEAPARSGALITVEHALDLGREILAVPGPIEREACAGSNALLRDGAHVVTDPEAVLRVLAWETPAADPPARPTPPRLDPEAYRVWEALSPEPAHVDEVARRAGTGMGEALAALLTLEVDGLARRYDGGRFGRAPESAERVPERAERAGEGRSA